jgi:hypothetical protein
MTASLRVVVRLGAQSVQGTLVALDRGLNLQHTAVRNAARAVASDRVAALMRADAAAVVAAQSAVRELSLVGA